MIIGRLGSKARIADEVSAHFPHDYDVYVEPFCGALGMFFNIRRAKHSFLNDLDDDVINLWRVLQTQKGEFAKLLAGFPISQTQFKEWRNVIPAEPLMKALRFVFLSNWGYLGKPDTIHATPRNTKALTLQAIEAEFVNMGETQFHCNDSADFVRSFVSRGDFAQWFCYCDPPYLGTENNYSAGKWSLNDLVRLLDALESKEGMRYAISEFDHPQVVELMQSHGLNMITIGERSNLKNRRTEVLFTNYRNSQLRLF